MKRIQCGLIVSDFDGTLLTSAQEVPARVRAAIDEYVACGGIFAVCTGRMLRSILPRVRELGLKGLVAAYQGTVIADIESGELLRHGGMDAAHTAEVCRTVKEAGNFVNVYSDDDLFTDMPKDDKMLGLYERITGVDAVCVTDMPMDEFVLKKGLFCQKASSLVPPKEQERLYTFLCERLGARFDVTCSANCLVEISPFGDDKGTALQFLAERYRIPLSCTVAVGDNLNDLSMIRRAGVGVAVANGTAALKAEADAVFGTNDEGALAEIIARYGFEYD